MAAARTAIDAGADLVIGHHAHVLQGVEFYQDGVIVYGLGNFAFEIDGDPSTAILNVWLDQDGVRQLEFVPAIIQFGGQPRLAEAWEAGEILQKIYRLTNPLNAR
jgi:poly-gamma-glutamate capsule biosynthesis protein CapA/YwtB (metallophosphatase superfamily)